MTVLGLFAFCLYQCESEETLLSLTSLSRDSGPLRKDQDVEDLSFEKSLQN